MKLADISNGPEWVAWIGFVIFVVLSVVFLSGHGSSLIAGYNTLSDEEKGKYDTKKMCKILGWGMSIITVLILISTLLEEILPAYFAYVFLGVIVVDCIVMIVLCNIKCKK